MAYVKRFACGSNALAALKLSFSSYLSIFQPVLFCILQFQGKWLTLNEQIRHRHVGLRPSLVYIGINPTEASWRSQTLQTGGGLSGISAYFFFH